MKPENVPPQLRERSQWVAWRTERRTKVPYNARTGQRASSTDAGTWSDFDTAAGFARRYADGVGYVLAAADELVGADLDLCLRDGELHPDARRIIDEWATYAEITPSGLGVRLIGEGELHGSRHSTKDVPWRGFVELDGRDAEFAVYNARRFLTITGDCLNGYRELIRDQAALDAIVNRLLPRPSPNGCPPPPEMPFSDRELLEVAFAAGNGDKIRRLWEGGEPEGQRSEGDMALAMCLAFYFPDPDRLADVLQQSRRERFQDRRHAIRDARKAVGRQTEFYTPPRSEKSEQGNADARPPRDSDSVAQIRRALFEEPAKLEALDETPAREELPGSAELGHRGQSAVFYSERGHGKSSVALVLGLSVAARGGRVFYWDRENGGALTRARVESILDTYPDWGDPLEDGRFVCRHYPRLDPHWQPEHFAEALAGFTLVIYDSLREAIAQLGGDPNSESDISRWASLCVTPLLAAGASVFVLDNVGHEAQDRPRGSSSKLDVIPQAYKVACTAPFSQAQLGSLELTCTRSRSGDVGRHWAMRLGAGVFELPRPLDENPDERAARKFHTEREAFRRICLGELTKVSPLGRDALIGRVRARGVKGGDKKLRAWLAKDASDPSVPLSHGPDGYCLRAVRPPWANPGPKPRATPLGKPRMSFRHTASEEAGPGESCDDPGACIVPTLPTAQGWRCERCDRYVPPGPGRARQRQREAS
jgi:putative DNA primase/helicase